MRVFPSIQARFLRVVSIDIGAICRLPEVVYANVSLDLSKICEGCERCCQSDQKASRSTGVLGQWKAVMASSSGCTQRGAKRECMPDGESSVASVAEYATAHATQSEDGWQSCELFVSAKAECESAGGVLQKRSGECGERRIEDEIERSKQHWSLLADPLEFGEVGEGFVAEVDNVEVFKALQMHPTWGSFFPTFGHDLGGRFGSQGELVVEEKFAEGGQAELYHAQVTWKNATNRDWDLEHGIEWVVKVFKEGTFLRQVHKQLPHGYLQFKVDEWVKESRGTRKFSPRLFCQVMFGILLENGRFAFLMEKEHYDLRSLIEQNMKLRSSEDCGPFSHDDAKWFMYAVAIGVKWVHDHNIVHRDLKASNVLVCEHNGAWPKWTCFIADYECSVGVVGTGFFRAPEILQALKEKKLSRREEVFSKDIYSYGMTCYEILTGKLPFEGHASYEYDVVLHGPHLEVSTYVDDWTHFLLSRCWQRNPLVRPSMEEIVKSFLDHYPEIRDYEESDTEYWRGFNKER